MTTSAWTGPVVAFGGGNNPDKGPSMFDQGAALLDPRAPYTYNGPDAERYGWLGTTHIPVISVVPAALAANNIGTSAVPVSGTPFTLTAGAGVTGAVSIVRADTGAVVTGLLAIGGAAGAVAFGPGGNGLGGPVRIWDPAKLLSRCVRVVSVGDDSGGTFLVSGYDVYGYPMSQLLTGAAVGTATTTKAFKYIASVTPGGTLSGSAITIGTTDVIGLPLRADYFGEIQVIWNNAVVTATTGFTAAVTTDPATALTGDVRGTYALQAASNGTLRLMVYVSPSVANISSAVGLTGRTQV